MEVFPASVTLVIRALVVSARWAGRARRLALERATAAADANREAALEARVVVLEAMVEQRDAHIEVLESRLSAKHGWTATLGRWPSPGSRGCSCWQHSAPWRQCDAEGFASAWQFLRRPRS